MILYIFGGRVESSVAHVYKPFSGPDVLLYQPGNLQVVINSQSNQLLDLLPNARVYVLTMAIFLYNKGTYCYFDIIREIFIFSSPSQVHTVANIINSEL